MVSEKIVDVAINGDLRNRKTGYIVKTKDGFVHIQVEDKVFVFRAKTGVDKNGHIMIKPRYSRTHTEKKLRNTIKNRVDFDEIEYETLVKISSILASSRPSLYSRGVLSYV